MNPFFITFVYEVVGMVLLIVSFIVWYLLSDHEELMN